MKELLKDALHDCYDMQRLAESKNAGLLAFNGALTFAASKAALEPSFTAWIRWFALYVIVCCLISALLNLAAISAHLKHKQVTFPEELGNNLQFFGTIANLSPELYLQRMNTEYFGGAEEITTFHRHLSSQVVTNAQIALRKFNIFNRAAMWTALGIGTPIGLLLFLRFYKESR